MKQMLSALALASALAFAPTAASATQAPGKPGVSRQDARIGQEARIPFVSFRTIRTFRPVGYDTVYLQDQRRNWYRADLFGPCLNLGRSLRIGVDTRFGNTLDRGSVVLVGGERCRIQSLVYSDGPPPRRRAR
jgi:hypothetical protein